MPLCCDDLTFNVHGSVHPKNILIYIQQDATLHSLLYLAIAPHDSGGTSTHHQEHIQLYLQHLVFVTTLLLPAAIADGVDTVVCAPDAGWKYHPKHVEQFPDIKKRCNVTSFWLYIGICDDLVATRIEYIGRLV